MNGTESVNSCNSVNNGFVFVPLWDVPISMHECISTAFYLRIENAEGYVLIAVYLFIYIYLFIFVCVLLA